MTKSIEVHEYADFLKELKNRIQMAQSTALRAVNKELMMLYWDIGRQIVEQQSIDQWGDSVIEGLAIDLQKAFPGIKGFSARNLWNMRDLYLSYCKNLKLQPLVAEISWTHNLYILNKCKDVLEREFYIRMVRKHKWSKTELANRIENQTYEKIMLGQTNFDTALPAEMHNKAQLIVKDEYTFDFLELDDDFSERQLENGLIAKISDFLDEMGGIFAYLGRQFRLEVDGKEYFIDILLYHRHLRCLIAVELKIGEFISTINMAF